MIYFTVAASALGLAWAAQIVLAAGATCYFVVDGRRDRAATRRAARAAVS